MKIDICQFRLVLILFASGLVSPGVFGADPLDLAIQNSVKSTAAAAHSQKRIDQLSDETSRMLDEYRQNSREIKTLTEYNTHLGKLLQSQEAEKESLGKQLTEIEITQREIIPLMLRMLQNLEAFVSFDLPFLPGERQKRLQQLKEMMIRADVTTAEKFRRVLEAYQIENDYGRTIEAYRAHLDQEGLARPADFLRLGRVALFYQTLDGGETGIWNSNNTQWQELPGKYATPVRNGLRIARKEAAPDLLILPVPAPEAVR